MANGRITTEGGHGAVASVERAAATPTKTKPKAA